MKYFSVFGRKTRNEFANTFNYRFRLGSITTVRLLQNRGVIHQHNNVVMAIKWQFQPLLTGGELMLGKKSIFEREISCRVCRETNEASLYAVADRTATTAPGTIIIWASYQEIEAAIGINYIHQTVHPTANQL